MSSDSEPGRIEVELTPTGGDRSPRHPEPSDGRGDAPPAGATAIEHASATGEPPPGHARTLAIAVAAAVVGLSAGWLLSNTGTSEQPTVEEPDITSAATSVTADPSDAVLEPIDSVRPTTTARPRRTVTTVTLPGPLVEPVELHPALDGENVRLVGVAGSNTTVEIDIGVGSITTRNWGAVNLEPFGVVIGEGWIVAPDPESGRVTVLTGDGDRSNPQLGAAWSLLPIEGSDRFWRPADLSFGPIQRFEQVDRAGEPTGPTIETQGVWPAGVDPAGGILSVVQGSTYAIGPDRLELVGDGELVAVSETHAVLHRCDAALVCGLVFVDRTTAEARPILGGPEALPAVQLEFFPLRSELSPDGALLALIASDERGGARLSVVDTESGATQILSERPRSGMSWSPDGRFGFFAEGETLSFYDRTTGALEAVGDDIGPWWSVDVRPPAV